MKSFHLSLRRSVLLSAMLAGLGGPMVAGQLTKAEPSVSLSSPRLLYVWDLAIPGDPLETQALLDFAAQRNIDVLAMNAYAIGYQEPDAVDDFTDFVASAHAAGLQVFALAGDPWFTVSAGSGVPGQPASQDEGWVVYENILSTGLFDGLLDNSLPYLTDYQDGTGARNYFWDDPLAASEDYLDWLEGLDERAGTLPFYHATAAWFDSDPRLQDLLLRGASQPRNLCWYVSREVDVMNVLAYRDDALSILLFGDGEMALGPSMIGVETQDLGAPLNYTTFYEEGLRRMNVEVRSVRRALQGEPNFRGISFHYYRSFAALGGQPAGPFRNAGNPSLPRPLPPLILTPKGEVDGSLGRRGRRSPAGSVRGGKP